MLFHHVASGCSPPTRNPSANTSMSILSPSLVYPLMPPPTHPLKVRWPARRGGVGAWHKALVVGSVSLWRRLLASHLWGGGGFASVQQLCQDSTTRGTGGLSERVPVHTHRVAGQFLVRLGLALPRRSRWQHVGSIRRFPSEPAGASVGLIMDAPLFHWVRRDVNQADRFSPELTWTSRIFQ